MDKYKATAYLEKVKSQILSGRKRIDQDKMEQAYYSLHDSREELLALLYKYNIKVRKSTIVVLKSYQKNNYILKVNERDVIDNVRNKKLLLMHETASLSISVFETINNHNSNRFLIAEEYLRRTKQRRLPIYKHIKSQIDSFKAVQPTDYTKQEWKEITELAKYANSVHISNGTIYPLGARFYYNGISHVLSYDSVVATYNNDYTLFHSNYDYSRTTSSHLSIYLATSNEAEYHIAHYTKDIYLPLLNKIIE